jgi:DNA-binding CsgD family transcriptional regulator
MLDPLNTTSARLDPATLLSPRELEVLQMVALGLTNGEIAGRLLVSIHAVKFHLAAIYKKLSVKNRTEAVAVFLGGAVSVHTGVSTADMGGQ